MRASRGPSLQESLPRRQTASREPLRNLPSGLPAPEGKRRGQGSTARCTWPLPRTCCVARTPVTVLGDKVVNKAAPPVAQLPGPSTLTIKRVDDATLQMRTSSRAPPQRLPSLRTVQRGRPPVGHRAHLYQQWTASMDERTAVDSNSTMTLPCGSHLEGQDKGEHQRGHPS